ncbi:MAG: hypothetical protein JWP89_3533 [Schlesneria sp.]|nr:hypothetical protein [Schlesneria sp.]
MSTEVVCSDCHTTFVVQDEPETTDRLAITAAAKKAAEAVQAATEVMMATGANRHAKSIALQTADTNFTTAATSLASATADRDALEQLSADLDAKISAATSVVAAGETATTQAMTAVHANPEDHDLKVAATELADKLKYGTTLLAELNRHKEEALHHMTAKSSAVALATNSLNVATVSRDTALAQMAAADSEVRDATANLKAASDTAAASAAKEAVLSRRSPRKVWCPGCDVEIDLRSRTVAPSQPHDSDLDPAFQRDKFLLHQKLLSINTRYAVCDEKGQEIMHVMRPTHLFRTLLAVFVVIFQVVLMVGLVVIIGVSLASTIGETATGVIIVIGIMMSIIPAIFTYCLLAPKRHITFYRDARFEQKLLEVLQDQKFTIRMMGYTVRDAAGHVLGRFRKDYLANLLRKKWDGFDSEGNHVCVIREDSIVLSLLRRFLGSFYGILRTNFVIHQVGKPGQDGPLMGEFNRKFTLLDRYVLDCSPDRTRMLDRRMAIAIGVLLDTAESR